MKNRRIITVGGGAAGFFGAIHAAEGNPDAEVLILERGKRVLDKVRISGGGRCNVTHACFDPRELSQYYPRGGKELLGPFHRFSCGDTIGWFADRGVELKIEEDGRMFPVTDDSMTIVNSLRRAAERAGVKLQTQAMVKKVDPPRHEGDAWRLHTTQGDFYADILYLTTGSNPTIWKMLSDLGHRIVEPVPSLFTLNTKDTRLRNLAGISVPWAQVSVPAEKLLAEGPLLITHWGLSGPAVLRLSAWGARSLAGLEHRFELSVNWINHRFQDALATLDAERLAQAKRRIGKYPLFDLPQRLWDSLVAVAGIPEDQQWAQLSTTQAEALARELTEGSFSIHGKSTFKEEFVTAGGVDLKEVDFKTFASKLHPTLFFAGEVLDIDAITGGFNFQAAWTGGYIAGTAIAEK